MNFTAFIGPVAASATPPPAAWCTVTYPGTGDGIFDVYGQVLYSKDALKYIDYDAGETWTLTAGGTRYIYLNDGPPQYGLVYVPEVLPFSPAAWGWMEDTYFDHTGWLPDVWGDYKSSTASTPPLGAWENGSYWATEADKAAVTGHSTGGVNTTYYPYDVDGTRLKYTDIGWTYYMVWLSNYWYICTDPGDVVATAVAKKSSTSTTPPAGDWDEP